MNRTEYKRVVFKSTSLRVVAEMEIRGDGQCRGEFSSGTSTYGFSGVDDLIELRDLVQLVLDEVEGK